METKKAKIELSEVNLNQLLIDLTDVFESKKINGNVELKEAVEISERVQVDLVLMDIKMPVLNGLEATRQSKK